MTRRVGSVAAGVARAVAIVAALLSPAGCVAASTAAPQIVVLVSIDGWRADYLDRLDAPHLTALAARGVRSEALLPAFPSKTFPNHYTAVTGLYPDHHGIVSNVMEDETIGARFTMSADTSRDPAWWGGEPLWVTARRQGLGSASMFWPGSEVPLADGPPDDWRPYDGRVPNDARVDQVLEWLDRPPATRPSFITLYFSDVDTAGHASGPDSPAVAAAAARVDASIGRLVDGIATRALDDEVTLILIADHGMAQLSRERQVVLDDYIDIDLLRVIESGPYLAAEPAGRLDAAGVVAALDGRHPALRVYLKADLPPALHYGTHPRVPSIVGLVDDGWTVTTRDRQLRADRPAGGAHGYPASAPSMAGLLIAVGAPIRTGVTVPPLEMVHLYALMCRLLGIEPAPHDGDAAATAAFWR